MWPLVGRVEEQRQIAEVVAAVRDGRTQVLFITGPAGIGKRAHFQHECAKPPARRRA